MGASRPGGDPPQGSNYPQRRGGLLVWPLVLGALLLLGIILFFLLRGCGTPGSEDRGSSGSQGEDTTSSQQNEQASSGGGANTTTTTGGGGGAAAGEEGPNGTGEAAAVAELARAQGAGAAARLVDADGNPVGDATFTEGPNGVSTNVTLQPGQQAVSPGEHGIHIHEKGSIFPTFEAAGEHFNPTGAQHGFDNPQGPHEGDLENIFVNPDGSATYTTTDQRITLSGGENSLLDSNGSALVIHESADDYQTDPSGNSGDRVAAGIIRAAATGEATTAAGSTTGRPLPSSGGVGLGEPSVFLPTVAMLVGLGLLGFTVLRRHRY